MNSMRNHSFSGKVAASLTDFPVRRSLLVLVYLAVFAGSRLHAQAIPTASSPGFLQVGGTFNLVSSDYGTPRLKGGGAYITFDIRPRYGIEAEFRQASDSNPVDAIYERTYEIGPRYVRHYGRYAPYGKIMFGRGVFRYPAPFGDPGAQNTAAILYYNMIAIGGGLDYRLLNHVNLRGDYEYQRWFGFPENGLTPSSIGIGVAYRFH